MFQTKGKGNLFPHLIEDHRKAMLPLTFYLLQYKIVNELTCR